MKNMLKIIILFQIIKTNIAKKIYTFVILLLKTKGMMTLTCWETNIHTTSDATPQTNAFL
jgi:hypothetical protein